MINSSYSLLYYKAFLKKWEIAPKLYIVLSYDLILVNCPITSIDEFIWIEFIKYQSFKKIKYLMLTWLSKWDNNDIFQLYFEGNEHSIYPC